MYKERYKDIEVKKIVIGVDGQREVYGEDLNGVPVWILLHNVDKATIEDPYLKDNRSEFPHGDEPSMGHLGS